MAFLTAENGNTAGQRHPLTQERYVLGRHPDCDIVVDAGAVSRHHAQLLVEGDEHYVEDMHSRNGTFVNDQLIFGRQRLKEGDRIRVCDISFIFHHDTAIPLSTDASQSSIAVLVDDADDHKLSTIMSKLDVSSDKGNVRFSATPEAKLKALVEITKSLGRSISLDQVLPQVLNSLFTVFLQADRGFIVLRDSTDALVPRWTKVRHEDSEATIRISRTITDEVVRTKQAILSADAASDERFEMSESVADFRIRSMMCAPLINADDEVIGTIQVDTVDQRHRFRQEDLEVLVSVAIQAAVAIDNAEMHEDLLRQREFARDLELAREVQKSFLPEHPPKLPGCSFFDFYEPANHIGGDYYDYIPLPDGRLGVIVADVVGHGVAAALLMSKLSASARYSLASSSEPGQAITHLNQLLAPETFDGRFITLVLAVIDVDHDKLTVVNAGHMAPFKINCDGEYSEVGAEAAGFPLMIDTDVEYRQYECPFEAGDCLLLFTDGITEAMNTEGELYGFDRLKSHPTQSKNSPSQLGKFVIDDVQKFANGQPAGDDRCLVCVGRSSS